MIFQFRQQIFLHMSSLVSNYGSLTIAAIFVHRVYVPYQLTEDLGFLEVNLTKNETLRMYVGCIQP